MFFSLPACVVARSQDPLLAGCFRVCSFLLTRDPYPSPTSIFRQAHHRSRRPLPPPPPPPPLLATTSSLFSFRSFGTSGGGGGGAGEPPRPATGRPHSADPNLREEGTGPTTVAETPDRPYGHSRSRTSSRDAVPLPAEPASVYGNPAGRTRSGGGGAASGWDRGGTDEEFGGRGSVGGGGGGSGGRGWVAGVASLGGGEARRLARKVGALIRDQSPSSGLEGFQVEEARLRLWVRRGTGDVMKEKGPTSGTAGGPACLRMSCFRLCSNCCVEPESGVLKLFFFSVFSLKMFSLVSCRMLFKLVYIPPGFLHVLSPHQVHW